MIEKRQVEETVAAAITGLLTLLAHLARRK
jgi:hypothetical protein